MCKLKKITMNGVSYLGELVKGKDGKEMTLKAAMPLRRELNKTKVAEYFKKKNIGELNDVKFGGQGTNYAICDLLPQERMMVEMAEVVMKVAKSKALQTVENQVFDGFLGN